MKANRDINEPLWCCCGVPGGFALAGISVSASVCLVKQNDTKAAYLKTTEMESLKKKTSSQEK